MRFIADGGRYLCGRLVVCTLAVGGVARGGEPVGTVNVPTAGFRCYTSTARFSDLRAVPTNVVYAGTFGGIIEFDNGGNVVRKTTRADGLGSHNVNELITAGGVLWAATAYGLSVRRGGEWRTFTTDDGLNDDCCYAVAVDRKGRIYAGTDRGISVSDGGRFRPLYDTHEFGRRPTYAIHVADDGSVWFAKENSLTRLAGDGRWETYQRDPLRKDARSRLPSNSLLCVATDAKGRPWIGTKMGLGFFDGDDWDHMFYRERLGAEGGMMDNRVCSLALDSSGAPWISHGDSRDFDRALGVASLRDGRWEYRTMRDGLPSDSVHRIRTDAGNSVWMATAEGGCRLSGERYALYRPVSELPDNHVRCISASGDGAIVVTTCAGTSSFRDGLPCGGLPAGQARDDGDKAKRDGIESILSGAGLRHARVRALAPGLDGGMWVGTQRQGLLLSRSNSWFRVLLNNRPFPREITDLCLESGGALWVGTATEGAIRLDVSGLPSSPGQPFPGEP